MTRKNALIGAGLFTGIVALFILLWSPAKNVEADVGPTPEPTAVVAENSAELQAQEFEAALAAREAALQDQLTQRQAALVALDQAYETQFATLEVQVDQTNAQLSDTSERVAALQTQLDAIQADIVAGDQAFQDEMAGLQNNLVYKDSQVRQEIEVIYAQLQQAYDELAAREAQNMSSGGGGGGSASTNHHSDDHGEGHDDGDHSDGGGGEHDD